MKITVAKIKRELITNYGWDDTKDLDWVIADALIKDTLGVINDILVVQKRITINK